MGKYDKGKKFNTLSTLDDLFIDFEQGLIKLLLLSRKKPFYKHD